MLLKDIYAWIYILLASVMIAVGRVYDDRLQVLGFNFSIILCLLFIIFSIPLLSSMSSFKINSSQRYLFAFLGIVFLSPILWGLYGLTEYGLEKYINFIFVVLPLALLSSIFKYQDVNRLFNILLYFIFLLAILGAIKVGDSVDRLSVLGGGPIVFARWMIVGILITLFLKKRNFKNFAIISMLFLLSIAAGSRGPILSILLTFSVFFLINFQKLFIKFVIISFISGIIVVGFGGVNIKNFGKTDRLITKDNRSKKARLIFATRSLELISMYPEGVGIGNWQEYCNKTKPHHMLKHQYPHNLILEVFTETGLFGGIVLLLLIFKSMYFTFFRMLKYSKEKSIYELLFYLQLFLFLNSLFSGSLNDSRLLFVVISISLISKPLLQRRLDE